MNKTCKACSKPIPDDGTFCPHCGQHVIEGRFTTRTISNEIWSTFTNVERGFLFSCKELMIRPGHFLRRYLSGATKPYMNVFRLIFMLTAISFLLNNWLGFINMDDVIEIESNDMERANSVAEAFRKNIMYLYFLMVPFFALGSKIVFRRHKLNFAEHLIKQAAWLSGSTLAMLPFYFLSLIPAEGAMDILFSTISLAGIAYYTFANRDFFKIRWISSFFLSILEIFLGYIFFAIVAVGAGFLFAKMVDVFS